MNLKAQAGYLLRTLLYWLLLFNIGRVVFIIFFIGNFSHQGVGDFADVFSYALRLDLSTAGYLLLFPLIVSTVALFAGLNFLNITAKLYNLIVAFLFSVITVADLGIYKAWGSKLNARAIGFLAYPKEAAASIRPFDTLLLVLIGAFIFATAWWLHKIIFRQRSSSAMSRREWFAMPVVVTAFAFVIVLMIRGGLQEIPVNESAAYYSTNQRLNHATVNTSWYVLHSLFENRENKNENQFALLPEAKAREIVDSLTKKNPDITSNLLATAKPNIVFIQLESFTADVVEALGGEKNVTPNLDTIIQNGLLFTNIYAPGSRTDQGLASILCAFPAQPTASIIKQSDKLERMPNLTRLLKQVGYSTSFYYGGEPGFGNIQSFVTISGFDVHSSVKDYTSSQLGAKWGAHDEHVLNKQANELGTFRQPFFSYLMTLSSHEPFHVPGEIRFSGSSDAERFKNSCAYTDRCLGDYFRRVSKEAWYANTLFILCADHGHVLPRNREYNEPAKFHVPLVFYGPALNPALRGKRNNTTGSQVDIASTILNAIHQPDSSFRWSVNLMDSARQPFAYYSFDDGVGMVTPDGSIGYDFRNNRTMYISGTADSSGLVDACKAYLQMLMRDYYRY